MLYIYLILTELRFGCFSIKFIFEFKFSYMQKFKLESGFIVFTKLKLLIALETAQIHDFLWNSTNSLLKDIYFPLNVLYNI